MYKRQKHTHWYEKYGWRYDAIAQNKAAATGVADLLDRLHFDPVSCAKAPSSQWDIRGLTRRLLWFAGASLLTYGCSKLASYGWKYYKTAKQLKQQALVNTNYDQAFGLNDLQTALDWTCMVQDPIVSLQTVDETTVLETVQTCEMDLVDYDNDSDGESPPPYSPQGGDGDDGDCGHAASLALPVFVEDDHPSFNDWDVDYEDDEDNINDLMAQLLVSKMQPHIPYQDVKNLHKEAEQAKWWISRRNAVEYVVQCMRLATSDGVHGEEYVLRKAAITALTQYTDLAPHRHEAVIIAALKYFTLNSVSHTHLEELKQSAEYHKNSWFSWLFGLSPVVMAKVIQ